MKKVNVLLSSYNGGIYITEQIESILKQTYKNIDVYIHDDGSSDNTMVNIKQYLNYNDNGIKVIYMDLPTGLKYPSCFIDMLVNCEKADYYAFSDQDDVWLPEKIERAVEELEKVSPKKPSLYYTSVKYCDSELNYVRNSRFANNGQGVEIMTLQKMLLGGEAMGMTFCFNNKVRNELIRSKNVTNQFKDIFIKIYCASCGTVIYDSKPSALYRRHENAVTNNTNPCGRLNRYYSAAKEVFFDIDSKKHIREILQYIKSECLCDVFVQNRKLIEIFSSVSFVNQFKKLFWPKRYRKYIIDELGYRLAILLWKL